MLIISSITLIISWVLFIKFHPVFWWNPDKNNDKIYKSPNYKNWKFQNINDTLIWNPDISFKQLWEYLFSTKNGRSPKKKLISQEFIKENF